MTKKKIKKETVEKKIEGLKWIKITDLYLIPDKLFKKFKDKGYKTNLLHKYNSELFKNNINMCFVLVDTEHIIRGFIYTTVDILRNVLSIIMCEIEEGFEEYELGVMKKHLEEVKKEFKLSQVEWVTNKDLKDWTLSKEKKYII